jgi:hypothetical protein
LLWIMATTATRLFFRTYFFLCERVGTSDLLHRRQLHDDVIIIKWCCDVNADMMTSRLTNVDQLLSPFLLASAKHSCTLLVLLSSLTASTGMFY